MKEIYAKQKEILAKKQMSILTLHEGSIDLNIFDISATKVYLTIKNNLITQPIILILKK